MLIYPEINPVALDLSFVQIHWYGLMYLIGISAAWFLAKQRKNAFDVNWNDDDVSDLIFYASLGVILGGRFGYALFYDFHSYINNPTKIFRIQEGGMSFHGGLIGVLIGVFIFAKSRKKSFLAVMDFAAPLVPIGLGAGRIGNFINSELWGKPTEFFTGMFVKKYNTILHPSQLYQFALEGVLLFIILFIASKSPKPKGTLCALFAVCYGIFRFLVEFIRVPDAQIGYLAFGWLTMGQVLSLPMIILGLAMIIYAYKTKQELIRVR